jgi:hypothetical protein
LLRVSLTKSFYHIQASRTKTQLFVQSLFA